MFRVPIDLITEITSYLDLTSFASFAVTNRENHNLSQYKLNLISRFLFENNSLSYILWKKNEKYNFCDEYMCPKHTENDSSYFDFTLSNRCIHANLRLNHFESNENTLKLYVNRNTTTRSSYLMLIRQLMNVINNNEIGFYAYVSKYIFDILFENKYQCENLIQTMRNQIKDYSSVLCFDFAFFSRDSSFCLPMLLNFHLRNSLLESNNYVDLILRSPFSQETYENKSNK